MMPLSFDSVKSTIHWFNLVVKNIAESHKPCQGLVLQRFRFFLNFVLSTIPLGFESKVSVTLPSFESVEPTTPLSFKEI
jgi:hypothetical protein